MEIVGGSEPRYVVTPWRDSGELLELRRWFYDGEGSVDRRGKAVNKVIAWRVRNPELPLLLDSTADIVDAVLQDERGLEHNALRLVYAAAVSRFITGFTDTQLDLRRSRPTWLPPNTPTPTLDIPANLLEVRHSIVHRSLPTLAVLKKAAQQSLQWLWTAYWSHLDLALHQPTSSNPKKRAASPAAEHTPSSTSSVRDKFQTTLKSYLRARKSELKNPGASKTVSGAAATAMVHLLSNKADVPENQITLLSLLVGEKQIIPAARKLGDTMSGAFLIWGPLLNQLCTMMHSEFIYQVVDAMLSFFNKGQVDDETKEAMYEWLVQILTSATWRGLRSSLPKNIVEHVLEQAFMAPTRWHLRLAETLLKSKTASPNRKMWKSVLKAAREDVGEQEKETVETGRTAEMNGHAVGNAEVRVTETQSADAEQNRMEMDLQMEIEMAEAPTPKKARKEKGKAVEEKVRGPQKYAGMWRPRAIGVLPVGWEEDE